jgi:hypothetical protein
MPQPTVSLGRFPNPDDPRIVFLAEYAREFMRDHPELNRLTQGYDHSLRHLKLCVFDTLSDWAVTPPFIGLNIDAIFDRGWFSLFNKGVIICALQSLGILHMRNYLSYSDGGVNVQTENPQMIQAWVGMMKSEYEDKKQRLFIAMNIENTLGSGPSGVGSEYFAINSFFGLW